MVYGHGLKDRISVAVGWSGAKTYGYGDVAFQALKPDTSI